MILFTLESALNLCKRTLSIDSNSYEEVEDLSGQLTTYAGTFLSGNFFYRPYYVIALNLWTDLSNNLISGEGAKFDQNIETTRRYLVLQQRLDNASGATINPEFACDILLAQIINTDIKPSTSSIIGFISF